MNENQDQLIIGVYGLRKVPWPFQPKPETWNNAAGGSYMDGAVFIKKLTSEVKIKTISAPRGIEF